MENKICKKNGCKYESKIFGFPVCIFCGKPPKKNKPVNQ